MDLIIKAGAGGALAAAATYTLLLAVMGFLLTARVVLRRREARVGIGDGGDKDLARRIRVHGNFCETVPMLLVMLIAAAFAGAPAWQVHGIGLAGLFGRGLHAMGLTQSAGASWQRAAGMFLTHGGIIGGALVFALRAWA